MHELIYSITGFFGFDHPLHPLVTHLVIGPIAASLIFGLIAWIWKKPVFWKTARYMTVMAFVSWFVAVFFGIMDWNEFYDASPSMFEITMKLIFAGILFVILLGALMIQRKNDNAKILVLFYFLEFAAVSVIGVYGGNIVYGAGKTDAATAATGKTDAAAETETPDGYKKVVDKGFTLEHRVAGANLDLRISYQTTGWVAVGFGHTGQMRGSDIIIGYVEKDKAVVVDTFGNAKNRHKPDVDLGGTDNVLNPSGMLENGVTTLSFSIPLNSGDKNDVVYTPAQEYDVIMAYGPKDQKDAESYHGRGNYTAFKLKL